MKVKNSKCSQRQNWMTVSKHWSILDINTNAHEDLNLVFAHHKEEEEIYPLATIEVTEAHRKDQELKVYFKKNTKTPKEDISFQLIEDTKVLCKNDRLIIPASLCHRAVSWYCYHLQHPGHSRLKETMISMVYWKGMCHTIQRYVKSCRSCQINKIHSQKYGHVPPKLVIMTPWKVLCVDLIGSHTLKGKDSSSIDFMCLTMINPATSWFEILELPTVSKLMTVSTGKGKKVTFAENTMVAETTFDKSSTQISNLVYKIWFIIYPCC
jgi:hypothetical protein